MNILMMTNTYKPIIGGLERSVENFTNEYRKLSHNVVIATPEVQGRPKKEAGVIRLPAIQNFRGTGFPIEVPISNTLVKHIRRQKPDIIHSHHPFLIGDTALRIAYEEDVPLVFTYHTRYEQYIHYLGINTALVKRFVSRLSTGYANLCDRVCAPSESIAELLRKRKVRSSIEVLPTGIYLEDFKVRTDSLRKELGIGSDVFLAGFASRLAPEKNAFFLIDALILFLRSFQAAQVLIVGDGPLSEKLKTRVRKSSLERRFHFTGALTGDQLVMAYKAMDVFVFASKTETQGLVLIEAMASGTPVVALDAPGVREVVIDKGNGRLIRVESSGEFNRALIWCAGLDIKQRQGLKRASLKTAKKFSMAESARKGIEIYQRTIEKGSIRRNIEKSKWSVTVSLLKAEWKLLANMATAAKEAITKRSG